MKVLRLAVCLGALLSFGARAEAIPLLQLDILGGHYDPVTQTIVSDGPDFTLVALLTPSPNTTAAELSALLNETYFISAAVIPSVPDDSDMGSFSFNSLNYNVTQDLTYGTPPLETYVGTPDSDLPPHGVFPAFFAEFSFQFSAANRTTRYDTALNPGGLHPTTNTTRQLAYYATFNITTSLLSPENAIHFDLYNSYVANCAAYGQCAPDEQVGTFAPFSHDAESPTPVPEAQSLMLMSTGLLLAGRLLSRKRSA